ncbi:hypothetical protein HDU98_010328 [Podochytrium sp. JEL0797]|nr:hypothetical protein HDU98_010328 [Podochytrium sp. JEL0797]
MQRNVHYLLNTCVVSNSAGDGSNSYLIKYLSLDSGVSLRNMRFLDPACSNENTTASFDLDVIGRDCTPQLWGSGYSVDILQTIVAPSGSGVSVAAVAGGIVGALLTLSIVGFLVYYYRKTVQGRFKHQGMNPLAAVDSDMNDNTIADVEQLPLQHQSRYGSFGEQPLRDLSSTSSNGPLNPHRSSHLCSVSSASTNLTDNLIYNGFGNASFSPAEEKRRISIFDVMQGAPILADSSAVSSAETSDPYLQDRLELAELKLPSNPHDWTISESARWVTHVSGAGATANFLDVMESEEIDGRCLLVLSEKQLMGVLKITIVGRQAKLMSKLERLKGLAVSFQSTSAALSDGGAYEDTNVLVLGGGNFGTCLAEHLAFIFEPAMGSNVTIYAHDQKVVDSINNDHCNNKYMKDTKPFITKDHLMIFVNKGIEIHSGKLPCDIVEEVWGHAIFMSGPSFAAEIVKKQPTCISVASHVKSHALRAQAVFHAPHFRVYDCDDVIGVEDAGALKNVIALAAGACAGLGFLQNARAAIITRGLAEIMRVGVKLGADPLTFSGLAGVGDLFLTTQSEKSRNYTIGYRLGRSESLDHVVETLGSVAEGVETTKAAYNLCRHIGVDSPVCDAVYGVLFEGVAVKDAVKSLMGRDPHHEFRGLDLKK